VDFFLQLVLLGGGFLALVKGADWLVDGSSSLARSFGVSPLFIGLTIVAFGTSAPELAVSVSASWKGAGAIAVSNVVGSNISNIALGIGLSALLFPMVVPRSSVRKEIPFNFLVSIAVLALLIGSAGVFRLERSSGIVLLVFFALFLEYTWEMARKDRSLPEALAGKQANPGRTRDRHKSLALLLVGLGLVVVGGNVTVNAASKIALLMGMSEAFVGLTIVAVGTSLPELVTSVRAAMKKESDIAIGNIVGSNIFNLLLILGLSAVVRPLQLEQRLYAVDMLYMCALPLVLWLFSVRDKKIGRGEGALLAASYVAYLAFLLWRG